VGQVSGRVRSIPLTAAPNDAPGSGSIDTGMSGIAAPLGRCWLVRRCSLLAAAGAACVLP
jgi:hypothetical protein